MAGTNPVSKTLSTLQSAYGLTKGIADLNEVHSIKGQLVELQSQILAAQESAIRSQDRESALGRRIDELEQQVAQLEAWEAEKQRYLLTDFGGGPFAYELKPDMQGGEPPHRICANCFQNNHKSILQSRGRSVMSQDIYGCPKCATEFQFGVQKEPTMRFAESDYDPYP